MLAILVQEMSLSSVSLLVIANYVICKFEV